MQVSSKDRANRPVPVLIGNGELVTTLNRFGYHTPAGIDDSPFTATQHFVIAGRRHEGPRWQLVDFGILSRTLTYEGAEQEESLHEQVLHLDTGEVVSRTMRGPLLETARTLITLSKNLFFVETTLTNKSAAPLDVNLEIDYAVTDRRGRRNPGLQLSAGLEFETADDLGQIHFSSDGSGVTHIEPDGARALHYWRLEPGDSATARTWIVFSDRIRYETPVDAEDLESLLARNSEEWRDFWGRSSVETGDESVDRFRRTSLYTLRCQATPWSIPPTVSKPYWDGGAFHDELYPFLGLYSGGYADLARSIPYYRLTTLPRAIERARGRGALYAWSSTERGEERDPHGHWYTERFHLGQIAATCWWTWLYDEELTHLEDLWPVIREVAVYFETQMVIPSGDGLTTRPCTDFDESVGEVAGGPMTLGAAIFVLERAAEVTRRLGRDRERGRRWERMAHQLRDAICVDKEQKRYAIPNGKPLHYSIVGLIAPFFTDVGSEFARNSVKLLHAMGRTEHGWKPGFNVGYEGTTWMWTAGHLAMCHTVLGDGERAWECVKHGPDSAGQFHSPNEHLNARGEPVVPWFTTGCGAWLTALHWIFVRVDDMGMSLLPAIPEALKSFRFHGLAGTGGVSVACTVDDDSLKSLILTSPVPQPLAFQISKRYIPNPTALRLGDVDDFADHWRFRVSLQPGRNVLVGE